MLVDLQDMRYVFFFIFFHIFGKEDEPVSYLWLKECSVVAL